MSPLTKCPCGKSFRPTIGAETTGIWQCETKVHLALTRDGVEGFSLYAFQWFETPDGRHETIAHA